MRVAPFLRDMRGPAWRALVDEVTRAADASPQHLAFTLLIVRLSGCLTCHTDSYRAMRGCTVCAKQSIRRFREGDEALLAQFERALDEVMEHLAQEERALSEEAPAVSGGLFNG